MTGRARAVVGRAAALSLVKGSSPGNGSDSLPSPDALVSPAESAPPSPGNPPAVRDPVDVLPFGESQFDLGVPDGGNLPPHIRAFVHQMGGDFSTPQGWKKLPPQVQALWRTQLQISKKDHPGRPERILAEMPTRATGDPARPAEYPLSKHFLDETGQNWTKGRRWVYDPLIGVPVLINTPTAVKDPRGIVVLLHGACGANSGPHSLVAPGNKFCREGFYTVAVPKPFHKGFGPEDPSHYQMEHHMAWLLEVFNASRDYYLNGHGIPRVLLGRSTGANEALEFSARYPGTADAVIALAPYLPGWAAIDDASMNMAVKFGLGTKNEPGSEWNGRLDHQGTGKPQDTQWTFTGRNIPPFPTGTSISEAGMELMFRGVASQPANMRRDGLRDYVVRNRLPKALQDSGELLIILTPDRVRKLFPGITRPSVKSDSNLATTVTPTLLYVSGPDLEYSMADTHHFLVWLTAAAENPNVTIVLAPYGDHDPFLVPPVRENDPYVTLNQHTRNTAAAFHRFAMDWLAQIAPKLAAVPTHGTGGGIRNGNQLRMYHELRQLRQQAGLPSEADLVEMRKTDPEGAAALTAQKEALLREVSAKFNVSLTYADMLKIGDEFTRGGVFIPLKKTDRAFEQFAEERAVFIGKELLRKLYVGVHIDDLPRILAAFIQLKNLSKAAIKNMVEELAASIPRVTIPEASPADE